MPRLVVVGGGISGLAAARGAVESAREAGVGLDVVVLERDAVVGGKARSHRENGWLVEGGPNGYLDTEPALGRLVRTAGLEAECISADAAAARRFVVRGGRLRRVSANPLSLAASGLLGPTGLARLAVEPFVRGKRDDADETVYDFAARRIGRQAADRLIAPMVLGVFAGDARRLSLPAAFPRLAEIERAHGSLVRGMLARRRERNAGGPAGPGGQLTSFTGGLQTLPLGLAAHGGFAVRCGAGVVAVEPPDDTRPRWCVRIAGDTEPLAADAVLLTGEPWAMGPLLRPIAGAAAERLEAIRCPPVAVVALGYGPPGLATAPVGFGALIPRGEGYRILGCLWDTHVFPGRSPEGTLLVRAMLGGAVDPDAAALPEAALVALVRGELDRLLGLRHAPLFSRVVVWPRAIPQYELGHLRRVQEIERRVGQHPGLFIAGNALHGIAFARAAARGDVVGRTAAAWLAARRST